MLDRTRRLSATAKASCDERAIFGFKGFKAGVEQLALWDDDDVEAGNYLVSTENLSYQPFSAIPANRPPELLRGGDPQAA